MTDQTSTGFVILFESSENPISLALCINSSHCKLTEGRLLLLVIYALIAYQHTVQITQLFRLFHIVNYRFCITLMLEIVPAGSINLII